MKKRGKLLSPKTGRKGNWKPLQLNESILNGGIEGLVGIEELVDYKPTIVQKNSGKHIFIESAEEKKSIKHKGKKAECEFSSTNKLISKRESLKTKKEDKNALYKTKLHKNIKQNALRLKSLAENNSTKASCRHLAKDNDSQSKLNKFLELEQLEVQLSSSKSVKKRKIKKKGQSSEPQKSTTDFDVFETCNEIPFSIKSKAVKRSRSSNIIHYEVAPKKAKKRSQQRKKKSVVCEINAANEEPEIDNTITKLHSGPHGIAKKTTSSNTLHSNAKDMEDTDLESNVPVTGMEDWGGLNLPDSILRALAEKGFKSPTDIQSMSLPAAILGRRDIMGAAETGSGKTLAFGIPMIYGILQQKKNESRLIENSLETDTPRFQSTIEDIENSDSENPKNENSETDDSNIKEGSEFDYDIEQEQEIDEFDQNPLGIGCVKVIDNVDLSQINIPLNNARNCSQKGRLYALVLTPTRELAVQVRDHLKAAAKFTGIKVAVVIGGLAQQKQERLLRAAPEIVVATPGRLWELIQEGNPHLQQVDHLSFLAIDETDRMVEQGHFQELRELLERINRSEGNKKRQNFVFSATLTLVHELPQRKKSKQKNKKLKQTPGQKLQEVITMVGLTNPKVVDITRESGTCGTLEEAQISCTFEEKDIYLYYFLIKHPGRTLVFSNSISCVRRLAQLFTILKCKPFPIHANMIQRQRLRNLERFRDSPTGLLLATDVAARGLDIPDVQHVIHYQVPRTSEGYIHRSGRTARASKEGLTLLLVEPDEQHTFVRLFRTLGRDQQLPSFPVSQDLFNAAKQRMNLAREIDQLELTSRRADSEKGWFQKAMSDMDILLDDDDIPKRISEEDSIGNRQVANKKRKQLDMLLSRPLFSSRV